MRMYVCAYVNLSAWIKLFLLIFRVDQGTKVGSPEGLAQGIEIVQEGFAMGKSYRSKN